MTTKIFQRTTLAFAAALFALVACNEAPTNRVEVLVYKSPTCSCCTKWEKHLEASGFDVRSETHQDMDAVKNAKSVPSPLRSCHTALVDGYVIEGHVPAADIRRLLKERPKVRGLAVPGMPMGSPGMEGPRSDAYSVIAIRADGQREVFSSYP